MCFHAFAVGGVFWVGLSVLGDIFAWFVCQVATFLWNLSRFFSKRSSCSKSQQVWLSA